MLKFAGFGPRILAHNIDLLVLLPLFYLVGYYIESNSLLFGLCYLMYLSYHIAFELSNWRGTVGKKLQKIKVIPENGRASVGKYFLRNVFKTVSILPLFLGFIMMIFDSKKRALHDRMAGTLVLFDEN